MQEVQERRNKKKEQEQETGFDHSFRIQWRGPLLSVILDHA